MQHGFSLFLSSKDLGAVALAGSGAAVSRAAGPGSPTQWWAGQ